MSTLRWNRALCALLATTTASISTATDVGGPILTNTTWGISGSPYRVTQTILVGNGATLTIDPGVELRFRTGLALVVGSALGPGTLVSRGTPQQRILFTTNDPYEGGTADAGDWSRVEFADHSADAIFAPDGNYLGGSILEHTEIAYGGSAAPGLVWMVDSAPYITSCDIHHSAASTAVITKNRGPAMRLIDNEIHHSNRGVSFDTTTDNRVIGNHIHDCTQMPLAPERGAFIADNLIDNNTWPWESILVYGGATVVRNTIINNAGGGISAHWLGSTSNIRIEDNLIAHNVSADAAAISIRAAPGTVVARNRIVDNVLGIPGIYGTTSSNCTVTGNVIADNRSPVAGGAVYLENGCHNWTFRDNLICNNEADNGGAGVVVYHRVANLSFASDPQTGARNTICGNRPYNVRSYNLYEAGGATNIDAREVDWGTCDAAEVQDAIYDFFDDPQHSVVVWPPFACCDCPADVDCDRDVDLNDLSLLLAHFGTSSGATKHSGDVEPADGDGDVDLNDLAVLLANFGTTCP